jgi:hypothetical protein
MTLEEAVKILNEREHRGAKDWLIPAMLQDRDNAPVCVVSKKMDPKNLTAFEAIAIAEKYAAGETLASVNEVVLKEWHARFGSG